MAGCIQHPPVEPVPELGEWSRKLAAISSQPVEFCRDLPAIARRFEAWWACEVIDRPIFVAARCTEPGRRLTKHLELLEQPERWFETKFGDMRSLKRFGEALPSVRVDVGPVLLGAMMGGRIEFGSDTTWTHAFIDDDWSNEPDWKFREDNRLWQRVRELLALVAEDARGRYLAMTPDLGGSGDVLLNLRGSEALCIDVLDRPERVKRAVDAIYPAWRRADLELNRIVLGKGAGIVHWIGCWSNVPYMIPACDFNYLIGPGPFNAILLPDIARQAATVGRAVFHLDGWGAANHIDALLGVPDIRAIQIVPGAGTPSALAWLDVMKKIQKRKKAIALCCPHDEVMRVCDQLEPEGLGLWLTSAPAGDGLDRLFEAFCKRFSG